MNIPTFRDAWTWVKANRKMLLTLALQKLLVMVAQMSKNKQKEK